MDTEEISEPSAPDIQFRLVRVDEKEGEARNLPIKYCTLLGFIENSQVNEDYRDQISQISSRISHFLTILTRNLKNQAEMYNWRISLAPFPITSQLFRIDSNQILLGNSTKTLNPLSFATAPQFEYQFRAVFAENAFLNFPSIENWIFFLHFEDSEQGDLLLNGFYTIIKKFRYNVLKPQCVLVDSYSVDDWLDKIEKNINTNHQLALLMIPEKASCKEFYEKTKTVITGKFGAPSQFIQRKTLETNRDEEGFYLRLLGQIAAKMGFAPWALKEVFFSNVPTITIGVNVRESEDKTIISVVGSMNKDFSKYWTSFSVVPFNTPFIRDLGFLVLEALVKFRLVHKIFPENLVIFRDGDHTSSSSLLDEKAFLGKLITQYQEKEKLESRINFAYIHAKISPNNIMFGVETINNIYQKKFTNPCQGSLLRISEQENAKIEKFLLFLQRHDSEHELIRPTKFTILEGSKNRDFQANIFSFCFHLIFLNFSFSSRTALPAPMQYAYKLGEFLEVMARNSGDQETFGVIQENLKGMAAKGKLYFI